MENSLPKITYNRIALSDIDNALKKEWLLTNGLGGYASSTILGINTRKYHGLLVAAFNPPVDRRVLLTKLDEEIIVNDKTYPLHANESKRGIQPEGYCYLLNFSLNPFPTYTYELNGKFRLKKTVFMPYEKNVAIAMYAASNSFNRLAFIHISPLVNSRHFHSVTEKEGAPNFVQRKFNDGVTLQPSTGLSALTLFSTEGRYQTGPEEWVETYFRVDAGRHGESNLDSSFKAGSFEFNINPNETRKFSVIAVGGKSESETRSILDSLNTNVEGIDELYRAELRRRDNILGEFSERHGLTQMEDWLKWLVLSADTFVVNRASTQTKSVIAGYHWFEDWGRDSLISLPGLTLVTGRFEDAKQILLTFKRYCNKGVVPNRFPDWAGDQPVYNTVDASLWYIDAVLQYLKYTNDLDFVREELWSTLKSILENHMKGTVFNICMDEDGLISHGPQLTWMDAAPLGKPVTPREGKAVEIQALWYNALKTMQLLATYLGEDEKAQEYMATAEKVRKSFVEKFWNAEKGCLFDVINHGLQDSSLRPNQIIAVSLDFAMLDKEKATQIVDTVHRRLWGVYGLKTLSDDDPRYKGKYAGDWTQRDNAYHNGTAWPWLIGPFVKAFLKLKKHAEEWRSFAFKNFLQPLFHEEVFKAGLGTVSEIFDGDPPHESNGCIAQAWSVAEPLRAYVEDVLLKKPPFEQQILIGYLY